MAGHHRAPCRQRRFAHASFLPAADVARGICADDRVDSVLVVLQNSGVGQGAALNTAFAAARAPLIAHMEADDACGPERLAVLCRVLSRQADCHAAFGPTRLIGEDAHMTMGMRRYVQWQNGLCTPEEMARARFVELPALHQTGVYKREALWACAGEVEDKKDGTVRSPTEGVF